MTRLDMWSVRNGVRMRRTWVWRVLRPMVGEAMPPGFVDTAREYERLDYVLARNDAYRRQRRAEAFRS